MRVRENAREIDVGVFGLSLGTEKLSFYVIPYIGYEGVTTLTESECEITDARIDDFIYFKSPYGGSALLHKAAAEGDLIYKLIDHQPEAMREFLRRLEAYRPAIEVCGTEHCPCCDNRSLNTVGCYEQCSACDWIDDPIQRDDPEYRGGENADSLIEAKQSFRKRPNK